MSDDAKTETVWAVCELMGHVKFAGRLVEQDMGSGKLFRCDIPDGEGFVTRLFGPAAVYSMTFVTEEVARHVQKKQSSPAPISPWDFPKALPERAAPPEKLCQKCHKEPVGSCCETGHCKG